MATRSAQHYAPRLDGDHPATPDATPRGISAAEIIAPGIGHPELLTRSPVRGLASAADLAPPPARRNSLHGLDCPSRINDRLHYRDGRVTDLQGRPIQRKEHPQ